jgi:hypothetical protein
LTDFNTSGPPQGSSGNTGKNPGLFGPGQNNWDLGLTKNFRFTERYRFQFRWEMFNAFNRTSLGQPYPYTSAGQNFGLIYYTQNPSRVMQAAAKFTF